MKLIVNDRDLSQLYKSVQWSGDKRQRTRSLAVSYIYRKGSGIPEIVVQKGDTVALYDDGNSQRFIGVVLRTESSLSGVTVQINAADILWYLGRNKVAKVYTGTADTILKSVCGDFNITVGTYPAVPGEKTVISTGEKTIYQVISEAYGNGYYIYADGASVSVGTEGSEVVAVLSGEGNLLDVRYTSSIENMVNRVLILDDQGNPAGNVQNEEDLVYGLLQDTYKKEKGRDAGQEAKARLKRSENTCSVDALGNWDCVAGKAVYIQDASNGMLGKYIITDDTHTFADGIHKMKLGVEAVMMA